MIQTSGLQPLKKDRRDFSHAKTFGASPLSDLPSTYLLVSTILNQGSTAHCTAYSACAIRASQAGIDFDPEKFFYDEGLVNGFRNDSGYDLRTCMATGVKIGFQPISGGNPGDYREDSYFAIDGPYDLFDSIRSAMWLSRDEKRCAELGTQWYAEWTNAPGGVIQPGYRTPAGLHAIKCAGWDTINGVLYLVIQNSYGTSLGNQGLFYFPRQVVNKEFTEGAYCWRLKPDPNRIQTISIILNLIQKVITLFSKLVSMNNQNQPITPDENLPPPAPPVQPATSKKTIQDFAKAQQKVEGYFPGSRSYKNNNPGNLRWTAYTQSLGASGKDANNFCQFKDYPSGFSALCQFITDAAQNKLKDYHEATILSYAENYAPSSDGNYPLHYAAQLASLLGVKVDKKLSEFL